MVLWFYLTIVIAVYALIILSAFGVGFVAGIGWEREEHRLTTRQDFMNDFNDPTTRHR